jgi:nucleotide-binding universal stress UspA family protein
MARTFRRILVAVDDSQAASAAVDEAVSLADGKGAALVFAHVVSTLGDEFVPDTTEPERMTTPALLDAVRRARLHGVPCAFELLFGDAPTQIVEVAEDLEVDLIVVGSRHLKGITRAVLGSTSRALLSKSTRPILVVSASRAEDRVAAI